MAQIQTLLRFLSLSLLSNFQMLCMWIEVDSAFFRKQHSTICIELMAPKGWPRSFWIYLEILTFFPFLFRGLYWTHFSELSWKLMWTAFAENCSCSKFLISELFIDSLLVHFIFTGVQTSSACFLTTFMWCQVSIFQLL